MGDYDGRFGDAFSLVWVFLVVLPTSLCLSATFLLGNTVGPSLNQASEVIPLIHGTNYTNRVQMAYVCKYTRGNSERVSKKKID